METRLPALLRTGARDRRPLAPDGYKELVAAPVEVRRMERLAELDRATGRVRLTVPSAPEGRPPRAARALPPDPDATGGVLKLARGAWIAKYNPKRAAREQHLPPSERSVEHSDVFTDYAWDDPGRALGEPWIHSWLMRGAARGIASMDLGDLVFVARTDWMKSDSGWLQRRALVGLWLVDWTAVWPEATNGSSTKWYSEAGCFPLRRFDFPVPILATAAIDAKFDDVDAFHDRSRTTIIRLEDAETVAVTRACGLPSGILTEPDADLLAPMLAGIDLGPPTVVRRRILDGARAAAHRSSVEKAARDTVVEALRTACWGVVSTESRRGIGSDLWARTVDSRGAITDARIEVKGLSGPDPWQARLTKSELAAAQSDQGQAGWWLAIVTHALRTDREARWLTSDEAAKVFTVDAGNGAYAADRVVASRL